MLTPNQIDDRFGHHEATEDHRKRYVRLRTAARSMACVINDLCPFSREADLALANLEQALMWANKSVAMHVKAKR